MAFYIGFYAYAIIVHTQAHQLPNMAFVYALMVPSCADQLLPQLLLEQFETLPIQYRHIEHLHERVWFKRIFFDKMTAVRT